MDRRCTCSGASEDTALVFGEDGELVADEAPLLPIPPGLLRPCPISALDGSWLLELERKTVLSPLVRGPMRIEVGESSLRVSGDMYTQRSLFGPLVPALANPDPDAGADAAGDDEVLFPTPKRWYPSFPKDQYAWYFRSAGVTYANGTLTIDLVRHLWNKATQEFVSTDRGQLVLRCRQGLIALPIKPIVMTGTLKIGGTTSSVKATKTSSSYRGCRVEVDAMVSRVFPASATIGSGAVATLRSIYATAGWDVTVVTDEVNVPEDANLTNVELSNLLTTHRQSFTGDDWRLWLFVGSAQGGLFGIMFDDDTVPREGAAGFADAQLGNDPVIAASARNRPLDEVPAAFLRTLVHEAGHAFNLFHPKHDVHSPGIGIEIMNQTGDVIGFATAANPYPDNAAFAFSEHDRTSLIHSPDPQVRPGWKNFGWGHGSLSAGLPAPVDAAGLAVSNGAEGLVLTVNMPRQAYVGEYVTAEVSLTNTGALPRAVTSLLTLSEGDLVFLRTSPNNQLDHVLDVALGCGPRPMVVLQPGESITNHVQVFFTNQGVTFTDPGRHMVMAQLEVDALTTVHSEPVPIDVRTPATSQELDISAKTLTKGVGRALALGDFANDEAARGVLVELAEGHADSDTGAASALVMVNSMSRPFRDLRTDAVREAAPANEIERFLDLAVRGRSAARALELAVTVASPTEKDAPVVQATLDRVRAEPRGRGRATAANADMATAERIAENFSAPGSR